MKDYYIERINIIIDFINKNFDSKITLNNLTSISGFSKYHFHRIFHSYIGEALYCYINRIRVEKAASLLLSNSYNITEIAFKCGFNDSATFSRAFKKRFNISPREWKKLKNSNIHQEIKKPIIYNKDMLVENSIREIPSFNMIYLRYIGNYIGNYNLFIDMYNKVIDYVELKDEKPDCYVIYHDSIGITEKNKLRISVGVKVDKNRSYKDTFGMLTVERNKYLVASYLVKNDEYSKVWTYTYKELLPELSLLPVDGYCFEKYNYDCYDYKTDKTLVHICLPVKKIV